MPVPPVAAPKRTARAEKCGIVPSAAASLPASTMPAPRPGSAKLSSTVYGSSAVAAPAMVGATARGSVGAERACSEAMIVPS